MNSDNVRFGCNLVSWGKVRKTVRLAVRAERAGFDTVAVPDHWFHPSVEGFFEDPAWSSFVMQTAIGERTEDVNIIPVVTDLVRHHPMEIAQNVSTLDHLTDGGIMLGLGAGEAFNIDPLRNINWSKPFTRLKEGLEVVKRLLDCEMDEPVSFEGEFFNIQDAYFGLGTVQEPLPPIYIGGYGPKMRKLAGRESNGWVPWMHPPEKYKKDLRKVLEGAKEANKQKEDIDRAVLVATAVGSDSEKAWESIAPACKVALAVKPSILKELGYPDLARESTEMWKMTFTKEKAKKVSDLVDKIPMKAVKQVGIGGTVDEVINQINNYLDAGVNHLIITPFMSTFDETVETFEKKIIPFFKND